MSYRRDNTEDEHIPLPIETVYNSIIDSLRVKTDYGTTKYNTDSNEHFNRIYFKYPPEWRTSNLGEKIINFRHMSVICAGGLLFLVCTVKIRSLTNNITNKLIINVYHKRIT